MLIMMMMMSVCMVLQSGAATSYNNDEFVKLKKVIEAMDVTNTMDVTTSSSSVDVNKDTAATDLDSKLGLCASIIQGYGYPCQEIMVCNSFFQLKEKNCIIFCCSITKLKQRDIYVCKQIVKYNMVSFDATFYRFSCIDWITPWLAGANKRWVSSGTTTYSTWLE